MLWLMLLFTLTVGPPHPVSVGRDGVMGPPVGALGPEDVPTTSEACAVADA